MAGTTSCISHPERDDFLIIRRHLIKMFSGDVYLAALVSLFEFWTNGELTTFSKRGETGIPWVQVGMPVIEQWMMGICGRRVIQEKLVILDTIGLLKSTGQVGRSIKSYLLDINSINLAIKGGVTYDSNSIGRIADQDSIGKTDVEIADQTVEIADRTTPLKSLGIKEQEERIKTPPTPFEDQLQKQSPTPDIEDEESGKPRTFEKRRWQKKEKRAQDPNGNLARLQRLRASATDHDAEAAAGVADLIPQRRTSDTPEPATALRIDFPARWNELVPDNQVDPAFFRTVKPPTCYADPVFISRFDEICRKAQEVIAAGAKHVNFGAMLKTEFGTGRFGWQKLLAGEYDPKNWKKPAKPADPLPPGEDHWTEIRKRRAERHAREAIPSST